jgi:putative PIN family toxin of toxin-antitoxin system
MIKIVVDTNIIVSAFIREGFSSKIIFDFILDDKVVFLLSQPVLDEYIAVLNREKFKKYPVFSQNAEFILAKLPEIAEMAQPNIKLNVISDVTDNKFLELAVFSNADYLITGNSNDFTISLYENVKILSPRKFCELFDKIY